VDQNSESSVFDPDHDIPRRQVVPLPAEEVRQSQRLLVNPALAILDVLLAVALIHHSLWTRNVLLFLAAIGVLFLAFLLFRFQCLDCGDSGWYYQSGRHACAAIAERCGNGGARSAGMRPRTQYLLWVYTIVAGVIGYGVFLLAHL
jgi:hypothetical protein